MSFEENALIRPSSDLGMDTCTVIAKAIRIVIAILTASVMAASSMDVFIGPP